MNWKSITGNLVAAIAAQGAVVSLVPAKYQPLAQAIVAAANALAALFQAQPLGGKQ